MNFCCVEKPAESRYRRVLKKNEIVGRVLLGSQFISLLAITLFTYSNFCQLWRILLHKLFLIFTLSLPWKLISITLQSNLLQKWNIKILNKIFIVRPFCWKNSCPISWRPDQFLTCDCRLVQRESVERISVIVHLWDCLLNDDLISLS